MKKEIKLKRIELENFKNHAHLELAPEGFDCTIYGDNATGKTTVYDALLWLLFGRDSRGNGEKMMEVKPLDEAGNVRDHNAISSVTAKFRIEEDGGETEMVLCKEMKESWTTRRGSSEAVYDGNIYSYFVNEVPVKKNEFGARVKALIDEDLFQLLTSVTAFAEMDWKKRRELLYELSGVNALSDRVLLGQEERFDDILDVLGSKSVDELKKMMQRKRINLIDVRDQTPVRINELERQEAELAGIDFERPRAARAEARKEADALRQQRIDLQNGEALRDYRAALRELGQEETDLELKNREHRREQQDAQPSNGALLAEMRRCEQDVSTLKDYIGILERDLEAYPAQLEELRADYIRVNGENFSGGTCPTCGQDLPVERLAAARARFEKEKGKRLAAIQGDAERVKSRQARAEETLASRKATLEERVRQLENVKAELAEMEKNIVPIRDLDDYAEKKKALAERRADLEREGEALQAVTGAALRKLDDALAEAERTIRNADAVLSQESVLDYTRRRIEELREAQKAASAELEGVDKILWDIEEFTRWKTRKIEDSVNGLFRLAKFRLFRDQANGGLEERCDVVYNGVPWAALNSGARISVGIDIINALSEYYGVTVPLFIDNAESVTNPEPARAQTVRLVVSETDKQIRLAVG